MSSDESFMSVCLKLAKKGLGSTYPNPMVGAVIVKDGSIIGEGFHHRSGAPHAEIEAIRSAKDNIKGATLYVNLEPCSHFGKTPPCVDEIIKAKISRVVYSTLDPNPKVRGKGAAKLKKTGIDVSAGILADKARILNEAFFTYHTKKRPFIALKFASSLDGKIATKSGDSKWITNEKARNYARSLRSHYQAVLVGINTVIKDNPHLGVRVRGKKDPLRIILDPGLKIPLESLVLRDSNVLIITTARYKKQKFAQLTRKSIQILVLSGDQISIPELLSKLKGREIISMLIEGGSKTLGSFVDSGLIDKIYAFYSPIIIGGKKAVTITGGEGVDLIKEGIHFNSISHKYFDDNFLLIGYISHTHPKGVLHRHL